MTTIELYEPVIDPNEFATALKTIRLIFHGTYLVADLVPSVVLDQPTDILDPDWPPELNRVFAGSKPIIEADRCLRVRFESILAVAVEEEFIELFDELKFQSKEIPLMPDQKACFPFIKVLNSKWKARIPEYQGGNNADLNHFKILSMDTCVDILGYFKNTEWIDNFNVKGK